MSEWFKEHAWKACVGETLPRVRIPLSPPPSVAPLSANPLTDLDGLRIALIFDLRSSPVFTQRRCEGTSQRHKSQCRRARARAACRARHGAAPLSGWERRGEEPPLARRLSLAYTKTADAVHLRLPA